MDPLLEKAIAEAHASAPQDEIPLHFLEVNHFTFTEGPVRVMRWPVTGPERGKFF